MRRRDALLLSAAVVVASGCRSAGPKPVADPLRDLRTLLTLAAEKHVRPATDAQLTAAARGAMLAALDPYSGYLDAASYAELQASLAGTFGGIGMRIDSDAASTRYWVVAPMVGSPAFAAGIRAGDVIVAVDGRRPAGQSMDTVLSWLRGAAGTAVDVEVERPGSSERRRLRITRAAIELASVRGLRRGADDAWEYRVPAATDVAYLRITHFARTTADEVARALTAIAATRPRALVLDLRHNQGGSLTAAIGVADHFLERGRIVSLRGRGTDVEHRDATPGTLTDLPVAALVDEASLSAAEIVAASLQDHRRALIVGARTYGKATVQQLFPIGPGAGAYRLTTAHYLRPSGQTLERHWPGSDPAAGGVAPDDGLAVTPAAADAAALAASLATLDEQASLVGVPPSTAAPPPDPALAAACAALLAGRR